MGHFRGWLMALLCCLVTQAGAAPLPDGLAEFQVDVLRDRSALLTLTEVRGEVYDNQFLPLPGGRLSASYTADVYWLRLTLRKQVQAGKDWRLWLKPAYLDDVRIYLPTSEFPSNAGVEEVRLGDRVPFSARSMRFREPLVALEIPDTLPRQIYLRIQTSGSMIVIPHVAQVDDFMRQSQRDVMWLFTNLGALMIMIAVNLIYAFWLRDRSIAAYSVLLILQVLGYTSVEGVLGQLILPETPFLADRLVGFSAFSVYGFASLLFAHFTGMPRYYPRLFRLLAVLALALFVIAASSFTPAYTLLAPLGRLVVPVTSLLVLVSAAHEARLKVPGSLYVAWAYALFLGLVLISSLTQLGVWPPSENPLISQFLATLTQLFLLQIGIVARAHQAQIDREASAFRWQRVLEDAEQERELRETQSQFLSMVAHEVRTPLAVISAAANTLRLVADTDPGVEERINRIERATLRMGRLFDMCLDAERIERRQMTPQRFPTVPGDLLRDAAAMRGPELEARLSIADTTGDQLIQADRRLLSVALVNLLDNAFKYSPSETPIQVNIRTVRRDEIDGIVILVEDQGPGVPDAVLERVFEKHFRAQARNESGGLGLGLYLTRRIISEHRGTIVACPGPGGRFEIFLPLT